MKTHMNDTQLETIEQIEAFSKWIRDFDWSSEGLLRQRLIYLHNYELQHEDERLNESITYYYSISYVISLPSLKLSSLVYRVERFIIKRVAIVTPYFHRLSLFWSKPAARKSRNQPTWYLIYPALFLKLAAPLNAEKMYFSAQVLHFCLLWWLRKSQKIRNLSLSGGLLNVPDNNPAYYFLHIHKEKVWSVYPFHLTDPSYLVVVTNVNNVLSRCFVTKEFVYLLE